jgi:UDP-N-acetylglucosamine 2-epimerase (non-hydrolysing)
MKRVITLIGTRPEIIKMSPLLPRFDEFFDHCIVHSGQHYSSSLNASFFDELGLRQPDIDLRVGSGTAYTQLSALISLFGNLLDSKHPDVVVVQGDTNTALGGSLAVKKTSNSGTKLVHIEAGARSFLQNQPEELNRKLIDQMADLLFAPYKNDKNNLLLEGIEGKKIHVVGNTVVDSCKRMAKLLDGYSFASTLGFASKEYVLATFHRQENVDNEEPLTKIVRALNEIGGTIPVVVPLHPRTEKMMKLYGVNFNPNSVLKIDPIGYRDLISLIVDCRFCLTDSGGVQEECGVLGKPAIILRKSTEHMRYIESSLHVLADCNFKNIVREFRELMVDKILTKRSAAVQNDDHQTSDQIQKIMQERFL